MWEEAFNLPMENLSFPVQGILASHDYNALMCKDSELN